ncbi:MAG: Ni/Fe hydrogenase subunit alpha [candidate division Zixibacteria bacterium]|nr:Ni/Fe hydrogenase subunit alpha [candidate division Zixibacteria bacterium]NIR64076.1 Ni/Fe hydrogenase subunit alpha [candidate division Zixibacteria bacterium]NIS15405.1 Ni/Fe hydrogenase subunit alpha [candidate division Zixibacteria bacterium]NIS45974.1 Ni/Fe hydrogenase subunit alpha [candidate division Zixibacteria bacterium]NIT51933.1 Ni/Fe hydrogenase subunit alpha [candidate division Zixibacteria bacterium]
MKGKSIKVNYLARVEGEGGLHVKIRGDKVKEAKLNIFEPPRFFEAFLRGRNFMEAPDITARICGICPIAYMMSSCHAMEMACGVKVEGPIRDLRRLIYCGEWIESHGLHIYMLHAPDFLGYEDAIGMAKDHPKIVKRGLELKKIGNDLMILMGGREIHPINIRVGGFYKIPKKKELQKMADPLKWARDASLETVKWVSTFDFPDFERDYEFVSVNHESEYPIDEGGIASNKGIDIGIEQYLDYFEEHHVKHSTSLHASVKGRGSYMTGPMARYSLNFDKLSKTAIEAAKAAGLGKTCNNPFKSIIVRAVETLYACDEALRIIDSYEMPDQPYIEVEPRDGIGHGATEAPRGTLYHRYQIDKNGIIKDARIIPPTSQNQSSVEEDLVEFVSKKLDLPHEELTWKCEQTVRNYDPCISCSCHFLKLTIDRK